MSSAKDERFPVALHVFGGFPLYKNYGHSFLTQLKKRLNINVFVDILS